MQVPGGYDRPYWIKDDNFDGVSSAPYRPTQATGGLEAAVYSNRPPTRAPHRHVAPGREAYIIEGQFGQYSAPAQNCFAVYTKMQSLTGGWCRRLFLYGGNRTIWSPILPAWKKTKRPTTWQKCRPAQSICCHAAHTTLHAIASNW